MEKYFPGDSFKQLADIKEITILGSNNQFIVAGEEVSLKVDIKNVS